MIYSFWTTASLIITIPFMHDSCSMLKHDSCFIFETWLVFYIETLRMFCIVPWLMFCAETWIMFSIVPWFMFCIETWLMFRWLMLWRISGPHVAVMFHPEHDCTGDQVSLMCPSCIRHVPVKHEFGHVSDISFYKWCTRILDIYIGGILPTICSTHTVSNANQIWIHRSCYDDVCFTSFLKRTLQGLSKYASASECIIEWGTPPVLLGQHINTS